MTKTLKIWTIAAIALIIVGSVIFTSALAMLEFDFRKLSTDKSLCNTYTPEEAFDRIQINVDTTDIEFLPATDGQHKIVCEESETVKHKVWVESGILKIKVIPAKWYKRISFFNFNRYKIKLYLPQNKYTAVAATTNTGDISLPKELSFDTVRLDSDTGDINCTALSGNVDISSDTGDVKLGNSTGNVSIETNTGDINISAVNCQRLNVDSDTGRTILNNCTVAGTFDAETDTGDIVFDGFDAGTIFVETDTGDVTGTLLSEKVFIVVSDTGDIDVPKSINGGRCEITTDTGDVEITIRK